jgi:hypothetical protein
MSVYENIQAEENIEDDKELLVYVCMCHGRELCPYLRVHACYVSIHILSHVHV